jgi:hypothetical protein
MKSTDILPLLLLLVQSLGGVADGDEFLGVKGWSSIQRGIWSLVYSALDEGGEYNGWTPFKDLPFPQNTTLLILRSKKRFFDLKKRLIEFLGEERTNKVLGTIIPSWGAFLIREVVNEDQLSRALTDDGLEILRGKFVLEFWKNIASPG